MVVLIGMGHSEIQTDLAEKIRLGQSHALVLEIARHIKSEAVGAGAQRRVVKQGRVGTPIVVQHQILKQLGRSAVGGIQRDVHACGGAAVHGVEHVGTESHRGFS